MSLLLRIGKSRVPVLHILLFALVSIGSIGGYFAWLFLFASEIPNADDYDVLLAPLIQLADNSSLWLALRNFLTPHNEHILFWSRLVSYLYSRIVTAGISFFWLVLFANVALVFVCFLLILGTRVSLKERFFLITPVILILFGPRFSEASLWATAALQIFWGSAFALTALLLAWKKEIFSQVLTVFFSVLCILTQANGLFCFLAVSCTAFARRELRKGVVYLGFFCSSLWLYLYLQKEFGLTPTADLAPRLAHLDYTLSFLGSAFAFEYHLSSLIVGGLLFLFFFALLAFRFQYRNPFIISAMGFVIFTAGANAISRISFGIDFSFLQSRYALFSVLFICLCYIALIDLIKSEKGRFLLASICLSLAFTLQFVFYVRYSHAVYLRSQLLEDSHTRWVLFRSGLPYPAKGHAEQIVEQAERLGLVEISSSEEKVSFSSRIQFRREPTLIRFPHKIEHSVQNQDLLSLSGWMLIPQLKSGARSCRVYLRFTSTTSVVTFNTQTRIRPDVVQHHRSRPGAVCGYFSLIPLVHFPEPGEYRVSVIVVAEGRFVGRKTRKKIVIPTSIQ